MYETTSVEVWRQRREEMRREAERVRLKGALRAARGQSSTLRPVSAVTRELASTAGILRRFLRTPTSAG